VPAKIDLSATCAALTAGTEAIAGPGVQPYVQFPWSWKLDGGWGLSGMLTSFFTPGHSSRPFAERGQPSPRNPAHASAAPSP
jgi:hypothetical protein